MKRAGNKSAVEYEDRIIAVSLHGSQPDDVWGVIRCAQLVPVYLPTWKLRVYVSPLRQFAVPDRVLNKLRQLGAIIVHVPDTVSSSIPPRYWRLMAADDLYVRYFLQRNAEWRLSGREAVSVNEWIKTAETDKSGTGVVHCIRDHPQHSKHSLVPGLWGAQSRPLRDRLNATSLIDLAKIEHSTMIDFERKLLESVVWPAVSRVAYCHDSVSPCDWWKPRHHIAVRRQGQQFIGEPFNQHHQPLDAERQNITDLTCRLGTLRLRVKSSSQEVICEDEDDDDDDVQ